MVSMMIDIFVGRYSASDNTGNGVESGGGRTLDVTGFDPDFAND